MKKSINDNIELVAPSESNLIIKEYSDKITHLLISVPPSDDGDPFLNNFNKDLQSLKNLKWVGYLSATSVYGDHKGEFVNETLNFLQGSLEVSIENLQKINGLIFQINIIFLFIYSGLQAYMDRKEAL